MSLRETSERSHALERRDTRAPQQQKTSEKRPSSFSRRRARARLILPHQTPRRHTVPLCTYQRRWASRHGEHDTRNRCGVGGADMSFPEREEGEFFFAKRARKVRDKVSSLSARRMSLCAFPQFVAKRRKNDEKVEPRELRRSRCAQLFVFETTISFSLSQPAATRYHRSQARISATLTNISFAITSSEVERAHQRRICCCCHSAAVNDDMAA